MSDLRTMLERGVGGATPPPDGFERMLRRRDRKRRNQRIMAGVVGFAVFVAAVWIVTTAGRSIAPRRLPTTGPAVPSDAERVGFIGVPPEGATPSGPESGELVISLYGSTGGPRTRLWVFADGRLIWQQDANLPEGANEQSTGYLEQRLTPAGVELLRSEIVSTGLFDDDLALAGVSGPEPFLTIRVRSGDRFVRLNYGWPGWVKDGTPIATAAQASALAWVDDRLTDPGSWLPASAWQDQEIRAYVPSRFQVCYGPNANLHVDASRILSLLPPPVEDLLRAAPRTDAPNHVVMIGCHDVTTEEARALADALDRAGLTKSPIENAWALGYRFEPRTPIAPGPIENTVFISFEPYLPDGEVTCSTCG